jgi:hypothetical protein
MKSAAAGNGCLARQGIAELALIDAQGAFTRMNDTGVLQLETEFFQKPA